MFKCYECGNTFEWPKVEEESRGEFWGLPAIEKMYYCPHCGGCDFDEEVEEDEEEE